MTRPPRCVEPICVGDDDGEIQAGSALAYIDNEDGTVTDVNTFLMWEKKSDGGGLHDLGEYVHVGTGFRLG